MKVLRRDYLNLIVVGSGGTTRQLLGRLGESWEVTVIDVDADRLARAEKVRPVELVEGDGSSRVVLERAGLDNADALVAATADDDANLEACRIASETGLLRVFAVAADPDRLSDYRDAEIPSVSSHAQAARVVESALEPRRISSTSFADGKAEAIEFLIAGDAPVKGMALKDLHSEHYLVAAILRGGGLIVPHGDTVLEEEDRVTVVGSAADFAMIVRTFTSGEARFPSDYGTSVAVALESEGDIEGTLAEALELTRNSQASALLLVHRDPESVNDENEATRLVQLLQAATIKAGQVDVQSRPVGGLPTKSLLQVAREESVGVVVLAAPRSGEVRGRMETNRLLRAYSDAGVPLLLSRNTFGVGTIVVPARDTPAGRAAARAAIDLADDSGSKLIGVAVVSPAFLAGGDTKDEAQQAMLRLREEAAVLGVRVRRILRQGNPVHVIEEAAEGVQLVVLGMPPNRPSFANPGISAHLARRLETSVLLVPRPGP